MNPIDQMFAELRRAGRKALMPFLTAGDPQIEVTPALLDCFVAHGCQLCELGFPYSDPIADGPTIQASFTRALSSGLRIDQIFSAVEKWSSQASAPVDRSSLPIVAMLSYAIVFRRGIQQFVDQAIRAGISGLIVPDLPCGECDELFAACQERQLALIQLIAPTTDRKRVPEILSRASGFVYYVSVAGVTGTRTQLPSDLVDNLEWLRTQTRLPICVGFGISGPEQIRQLAPYADGLIVGSALVKQIEQSWTAAPGDIGRLTETVGQFLDTLQAAWPQEATNASQ